MTAKELFEELGYEYYDYRFTDEYYQRTSLEEDKWKSSIEFLKPDKMIWLSEDYNFIEIDLKTLSAIYQRVKELGWLEE